MAIKQKTSVTLRATAECPSHSLANISIRDLNFPIDEPVERGGTNSGPTPTDMAIAALVGCTNVIGHKCADKLGVDLGTLSIDASCQFDRRGVMISEEVDTPFQKIVLTIKASGPATQQELDLVSKDVAKYCPLAKLFRQSGTEIEEVWQSA